MAAVTDPKDPGLSKNRPDGQQENYLVLTEEERAKGFVRPVRDSYTHLLCGSITTMGRAIAETYARNPKFYGATFCAHCRKHFPLFEYSDTEKTPEGHPAYKAMFSWIDGSGVGT